MTLKKGGMMYRPEGWKNPYPDGTETALTEKHLLQAMEHPQSNYEVFEAGADAMLEGLRKNAFLLISDGRQIGYYPARPQGPDGHCVFIPDDE